MKKLNLSFVSFTTAGAVLLSLLLVFIGKFSSGTASKILTICSNSILYLSELFFFVVLLLKSEKKSPMYVVSIVGIAAACLGLAIYICMPIILLLSNGIDLQHMQLLEMIPIITSSLNTIQVFGFVFALLAFVKPLSDDKAVKYTAWSYPVLYLLSILYAVVITVLKVSQGNVGLSIWLNSIPDLLIKTLLAAVFCFIGLSLKKDEERLTAWQRNTEDNSARFSYMKSLSFICAAGAVLSIALGMLAGLDSEELTNILILVLSGAAILHMLIEIFSSKNIAPLNAVENATARQANGMQPMTDEEAAEWMQKMDDILSEWTPYTDENGNESFIMTKYSQTKKTRTLLEQVRAAMPDNETVVERYNMFAENYNTAMKRHYNGSTKYIILAAVVAVALGAIAGSWSTILTFFGTQIVVYIIASMTPTYILNKIALKPAKPKFMSGFIAGIFGLTATAATYKITTHWSDGTTTTKYDDSEKWTSAIISLVLIIFICFFMFIPAIMNYIRNYILHV
ncbi:MAG: hypothetical protein IJ776_09915 [Paludibacteraceae bacterium]|nr:hypothetical protein [Paludibacteraceae bacterium]